MCQLCKYSPKGTVNIQWIASWINTPITRAHIPREIAMASHILSSIASMAWAVPPKWNGTTSTQQLPCLDRHLDETGLLGCNGGVGSGLRRRPSAKANSTPPAIPGGGE